MANADAAPRAAAPVRQKKPRLAFFVATAGGLGYLPKAPGTWGSLAGVALAILASWLNSPHALIATPPRIGAVFGSTVIFLDIPLLIFTLAIAVAGAWASNRAAEFTASKDPQFVVVDEVSGQLLTYFFPFTLLNWKSWLLGFILFRVFDIWKPFPARQAESLPGGWGIMADDWIAGIYAAIVLYLLRRAGL